MAAKISAKWPGEKAWHRDVPCSYLVKARRLRDEAREMLAEGKDPSQEKQQAKHRAMVSAANTFGQIAQEFIDKRKREGLSESTVEKSAYYISRLGSAFNRLPIGDIAAPDLLSALRRIEATGNHETTRRALQLADRVCRYGVASARLQLDPSRDLRGCADTKALRRDHRSPTGRRVVASV